MVADKEYDIECEIDRLTFTKNEAVKNTATTMATTNKKKHKKKKKRIDTTAPTIDLPSDDAFGDAIVPVSVAMTHLPPAPRTPSKKPMQRGLLPSAFTDESIQYGQTDPPTIPVAHLFLPPNNNHNNNGLPCGEFQYDVDRSYHQAKRIYGNRSGRSYRITPKEAAAEAKLASFQESTVTNTFTTELDLMNDMYQKLRLGGEIHRQVRHFTQSIIQPGIVLSDMCTQLENMNRSLTQEAGLQRGIAFPTGCSINHVAAHYTPNTGDRTTLQYNDVMKVDFGVQMDGYIIDSAWTVAFHERYDPLLQAVREATEMGIATAGVDQRLCEIGANIQEVMESYEIELQNQIYPIRAIRNLAGHSIDRYQIHGTKSVPIVKNGCDESIIMEEYELYAIETFGSTGRGYVVEDMECSHYMKRFDAPYIPLRMTSSKKLLHHIDKTFGTLAFCRRWLDREDGGSAYVHGNNGRQVKYMGALKNLCDVGIIQPIPPLCDVHGCYTAQYEHTFMIQPNGKKEIFSRGTDY